MVIDRHHKGRNHRILLVCQSEGKGTFTAVDSRFIRRTKTRQHCCCLYNFCVLKIWMKSIDTSLVPFNNPLFTINVLRMMCTSVYIVVDFVRSTKLNGDINNSHSMCFNENTAWRLGWPIIIKIQHYNHFLLSLKYFKQYLVDTKYVNEVGIPIQLWYLVNKNYQTK
jgi:hypothetical protein